MSKAKSAAHLSLRDRLIKNSSIDDITSLAESKIFNEKDKIRTSLPALNIASSGDILGGFSAGLTIFAGPSKHFKSMLGLQLVAAYLKKYDDAMCIFIDSEFGITPQYLKANKVDPERVIHAPVYHIEMAKFEIIRQLENVNRGDHVIIFMDSLGNCASKKELDDAIKESEKADMSRAKSIKSLFRMVTPYLSIKNIPMVVINHVYEEQGMFAKTIMSGGTGPYLSADDIFFISRAQEKEDTEVKGYRFTLTAEKSRYIKEKSKIPLYVYWDRGIDPFSGLFELGLESGAIVSPTKGFYEVVNLESGEVLTKKIRKDDITKEHYIGMLKSPLFNAFVKDKYQIPADNSDKQLSDDLDEVFGT